MGNLDVDQSRSILNQTERIAGTYETAAMHTFVINLTWDI